MYRDVGIHTVEVASDELDPIVVANLSQLILWQKRKHSLDAEQQEEVIEAFQEGLERSASALQVMCALELSQGFRSLDTKTVLYQAIWSRALRVDLFDRFYIDKPMLPESKDVLEEYAEWFGRPTT